MGYTTNFSGSFQFSKKLTKAQATYLQGFADTRHMQRDITVLQRLLTEGTLKARPCPKITTLGVEGEYYVPTNCDQDNRDNSVVDGNQEPSTQPGLWCQWVPSEDRTSLEWNGAEKFYNYVEWLQYLLQHFITPWGLKLNGEVQWSGEDAGDTGTLRVRDNVVSVRDHQPPATAEELVEKTEQLVEQLQDYHKMLEALSPNYHDRLRTQQRVAEILEAALKEWK